MIDYSAILNVSRLRQSSRPGRTVLTESESDRGRVLFSPAFRRLQQKAQVFSMEPNAAVRSRLTHSFEVSQLGRYLTDEICQKFEKDRLTALEQGALVNFVETACLMHDIGNPPFGHFGEAAIQQWFEKNGRLCFLTALEVPCIANDFNTPYEPLVTRALADFCEFDGNPQGLRVVARLQWNTDEFGLNLTKTTLASFLKYIRSPADQKSSDGFKKKPGYFLTEEGLVKEVWQQFGYSVPQRFPLAYIMEAADDIAYCISDLEDSLEKEIVRQELALPEIERRYMENGFDEKSPCHAEISKALRSIISESSDGRDFAFTDFRTAINSTIVRYAATKYVENEESIAQGSLSTLLPETEPPGHLLKVFRSFCKDHVYNHVSVQRVELAGYNAIYGLLEQFKPLLTASRTRFDMCVSGKNEDHNRKRILLEPKLFRLFPPKYIKVYNHHREQAAKQTNPEVDEWIARAHLIVDFISGMTDDFAMTTYRTLAGIEL